MTSWPAQPVVLEVNTWVWLGELARHEGGDLTLADVPARAWDALVLPGIDAVWLMGVWRRSAAGLQIALADEALQAGFRSALPDLRPEDVVGSPYSISGYVADDRLGGRDALAVARQELARRGARLLLDYVPNHVGPDHPWTHDHPEAFVRGTAEDLSRSPDAFVQVGDQVMARGRDPYFPPWPDVVQLDAFSPEMRGLTVETLSSIGDQCDGVRCDMAMLVINDVFARTWPALAATPPAAEFWPEVLGEVRSRHPDLLAVAESYWDLEPTLLQHGFDHCYDKRLYDRLVEGVPTGVAAHLQADPGYQAHLLRFLENHDEPRAAVTLAPQSRERAAAVAVATLPGATLWHDGQLEGRRVRVPVFLARRPDEPPDAELGVFYRDLLRAVAGSGMRSGAWQALECRGWPDNQTCANLLAWCWRHDTGRHVVVVNYSATDAQARVPLPGDDLRGRTWALRDLLTGDRFERQGDEMHDDGLYVALPAWGCHVLACPG